MVEEVKEVFSDLASLFRKGNKDGASGRKKRPQQATDDFDVQARSARQQRSHTELNGGVPGLEAGAPGSPTDGRRANFLDLIESKSKNLGATLGLIDDLAMPQPGQPGYSSVKVNRLMEEDCLSMRNEPIDPLETFGDMAFDDALDGAMSNAAADESTRTKTRRYSMTHGSSNRSNREGSYLDKVD